MRVHAKAALTLKQRQQVKNLYQQGQGVKTLAERQAHPTQGPIRIANALKSTFAVAKRNSNSMQRILSAQKLSTQRLNPKNRSA